MTRVLYALWCLLFLSLGAWLSLWLLGDPRWNIARAVAAFVGVGLIACFAIVGAMPGRLGKRRPDLSAPGVHIDGQDVTLKGGDAKPDTAPAMMREWDNRAAQPV
jgi:hypothetical protein